MRNREFIPQMQPSFGLEEKQALMEYMDEGGFLTEFKKTQEFEMMLASFTGAKHCIVVNNGTVSLTMAAIAAGVNAGDDVIVPNYTMIATPNSIKMIGANPIFVDVEPDTLCMDLDQVRNAITPQTKAIIFVSANGRFPSKHISSFVDFSRELGISLIEDAAQSLGSYYQDGKHIGRAGDVGSFSFSAPKIISTGQGGALITDDDEMAFKLRRLKDFGRASGGNDTHDSVGYNFKFTDLQACVGIEQMKKLPVRILRKKEIWKRYQDLLDDVREVQLFKHDLQFTTPWFIDARVKMRDELSEYLKKVGVGTRKMYPPINKQLAYSLDGNFPVSNEVGLNGIWFPSDIDLTDLEIDRICEAVRMFYS